MSWMSGSLEEDDSLTDFWTMQEYSPEFTEIGRRKCSDLADTGSVMLKRVTLNPQHDQQQQTSSSPVNY